MKLLGQSNSINVRKVLWTCAELGLSPNREDWGGDTRPTSDPDFLGLNAKGLVPVLIDGTHVLTESNTICRYLAVRERRADLMPTSATGRASVESWMDWQATDLNNAWRYAFMGIAREHPDYTDLDRQLISVRAWNKEMQVLDARLASTQGYVCGDNFTLADIVLALSTNRWEMTPFDRPDLPAVSAWMNRMTTRQGFVTHCRNGIP